MLRKEEGSLEAPSGDIAEVGFGKIKRMSAAQSAISKRNTHLPDHTYLYRPLNLWSSHLFRPADGARRAPVARWRRRRGRRGRTATEPPIGAFLPPPSSTIEDMEMNFFSAVPTPMREINSTQIRYPKSQNNTRNPKQIQPKSVIPTKTIPVPTQIRYPKSQNKNPNPI